MICTSVKWDRLGAVAITFGICISFMTGCAQSTQESQVSGQVSLDGNQIGPGTIVFAPVGEGTPAIGPIDEKGNYSMSTSHEVGLGAGKYKVAVSVRELPPAIKRGDRVPPGKLLIPEKYEDSATSGLEYEVAPGPNTIDIELKSQSSRATTFGNSSLLFQCFPESVGFGAGCGCREAA
jgi:hypothetical protein